MPAQGRWRFRPENLRLTWQVRSSMSTESPRHVPPGFGCPAQNEMLSVSLNVLPSSTLGLGDRTCIPSGTEYASTVQL